ncbi:MAG: flagellar hook capping protein [Desulfobacula sp.]|nr:flagellar hook capping protein [Desulfobacula sp.]
MTISSAGNNSIDSISSSYQSSEQGKTEKEDALGRDTFLTMLVAQLQNQDPLNPMEGSDFSAQLAQFSQLEQLINLNDSMGNLAAAYANNSEDDIVGYIGKQVTGNVDVMSVDEGSVSGGFYNLSKPADIMITIKDAQGSTIKTLYEGQQSSGSHIIAWDGTDNDGNAVEDGSYKYTVLANTGYGYSEIPSLVTGKVDGVTYNNDKAYLVVQGILLDPDSLTAVQDIYTDDDSGSSQSPLEYLGKTISSNSPIVLVDDGAVSGDDLSFNLESAQDVTITVYNSSGEAVTTITKTSDETSGGENSVLWNGVSDSGYQVSDGLYYYTVQTESGYATTPVSEEVTGIKYMNGGQYLVLGNSGRLVSMSTITGIN